jgi:TetR/AcrR family transcriptional regulator
MTRNEAGGEIPDRQGPGKDSGAQSETPSERLPRKERERERHRRELLESAERLLERKTYFEIGVQEIAEEAEFSVGYVYKLFPSKEEIFGTLIRIKHEEMSRILDHHLSEPVGVEARLRNLVHGLFAWLNENPAYTSSSVRELLLLSSLLPGLAAETALWDARNAPKMTSLFAEGISQGVFGEEDPEIMAKALKVLMQGFILEDLLHGRENTDWTDYVPIVLRIFMRAFAAEGGRR